MDGGSVESIAIRIVDRRVVRRAERHVARRVLVQQRVVEHSPERPDPALPVHERNLAEPGGTVV